MRFPEKMAAAGSMLATLTAAAVVGALAVTVTPGFAQAPRFEVTIPEGVAEGPVTGRLVLFVAKGAEPEPRLRLSPSGPAIFGVDLEQVEPGAVVVLGEDALGYPLSLSEIEPGEYHVQAVINVYERVSRADGHTIWVPFNDGRQQVFSIRPGNLYSDVVPARFGAGGVVRLAASHIVPEREPPADTEWIQRVRIRSEMLSRFWGRPVYVHATVLLPKGYDEDPDRHYPAVYTFGHGIPFGFTTDSTRVRGLGEIDPVRGVETGYDFHESWISDDFPRIIAISFQQQTPYFPDSYSINSANNGPYGDALVEEVIPALEARFRIIAEPYARLVEGASTGGWQSLALQLHYPDYFGGAWVLQPDPIDFRSYLLVDIYEDDNAFTVPVGPFLTAERQFRRTVEGQPVWSMRELSRFEAVLGSRGRSGFQLGGWEAVYGPVGPDGYPKPLWDKLTGEIDHEVAAYMRDNGYDLRAYAERNWGTLGPKIVGKLHFFAGDMDDFYLNRAVYRFEEFLKSTTSPHYEAEFIYGRPMKGHAWHAFPWAEMVRRMAEHVRENAPARVGGQ